MLIFLSKEYIIILSEKGDTKMLIDFSFKNFMSFGDECCFDMLANSDKQHRESLIDGKYSRVRLIYGANASGKTSFIRAVAFVRWFILNSNQLLENMPIPVVPFKFRHDAKNIPSEFALTFVMQGKKYHYAFSCTQERVIYEKLDVYNTAKPTNIFERTDADTYEFKRDVRTLRDIASKTTRNKLFLASSANWNYPLTKPVVEFLLNTLLPYSFNEQWQAHIAKIKADGQFEDYKKFCLKFFNNADISIDDFAIEEKKFKEMPKDPMLNSMVSLIAQGKADLIERIENSPVYNINIQHAVTDDDAEEKYTLNLQEESLGTIQMFELSPILYHVFQNGITFFVDEIDRSLHPILVRYIVSLFLDPEINVHNAQLIANTHDTNLLDLELLRRDEIWFTERDFKSGKTTMYPLTDFSPRKNENIEKAYILGRFGAIPFIKEN